MYNECAICQEDFLPDDIVVNTACNHNFHWFCRCGGTGGKSGLYTWVHCEGQTSCPSCRSHMFIGN
jgi:hypothetical protein